MERRQFLQIGIGFGAGLLAHDLIHAVPSVGQALPANLTVKDPRFSVPVLNPTKIDKFIDALPVPGSADWPIVDVRDGSNLELQLIETSVPILPSTLGFTTPVWCYRGKTSYTGTFLGPTVFAQSNVAVQATYDYTDLSGKSYLLKNGANTLSVVDKHLHGTDMQEPEVRFIAHLHGAKGITPDSDGYPEAWVAPGGTTGNTIAAGTLPATNTNKNGTQTHKYPNTQTAALLWYHDHALGITRLNVYAGGAGGYIITDSAEQDYITKGQLPDYGIPLIIQDRMFYPDGRLAYPDLNAIAAGLIAQKGCTLWPSTNGVPDISTRPEYFGDVIVVNGRAWPYLSVEPKVYRFRILNGCNSRVLDLSFQGSNPPPTFAIIGTEGGFLPGPSDIRSNLVIGGAERFDVLIDFRNYAGKTLTLTNKGAKKPFPGGTPPNPQSDALVMQFRVSLTPVGQPLATPPVSWNSTIPPASGSITRRVLLYEGRDPYGRIQPLLGSFAPPDDTDTYPATKPLGPYQAQPKFWDDSITENPTVGTIEVWEIYNTTVDSHPIHLHEVLFRVLNRQLIAFDPKLAAAVCTAAPPQFPVTLTGAPIAAVGYETGFKDTVLCPPGQVTRIVVDFRNAQPGRFVWHCHILEHEDHEMMRPYDINPPRSAPQRTLYNTPGNIIQLP